MKKEKLEEKEKQKREKEMEKEEASKKKQEEKVIFNFYWPFFREINVTFIIKVISSDGSDTYPGFGFWKLLGKKLDYLC